MNMVLCVQVNIDFPVPGAREIDLNQVGHFLE